MSDPVQTPPRSEAQIEASRRNGAMSQGPVTEEGKVHRRHSGERDERTQIAGRLTRAVALSSRRRPL